jgi:hypothetical protein
MSWLVGGVLASVVTSLMVRMALQALLSADAGTRWILPKTSSRDPRRVAVKIGRWSFYAGLALTLLFWGNLSGVEQGDEWAVTLVSFREMLPKAGQALVILLVGWVVASFLRLVAMRLLRNRASTKASSQAGAATGRGGAERPLGDAVFWLTMLVSLPPALNALGVDALSRPVDEFLTLGSAQAPKLAGAALFLLMGWFAASLVGRVAAGLLGATSLDRWLLSRTGGKEVTGSAPSALVGRMVFVFALLPVVLGALRVLDVPLLTAPFERVVQSLLDSVPDLLTGVVILVLGGYGGLLLGRVAEQFLQGLGIDRLLVKAGLAEPDENFHLSRLGGRAVFLTLLLIALTEASAHMGFEVVADLTETFMHFGIQAVLGLGLAFGAFLVSRALADVVADSRSGRGIPRWAIIAPGSLLGVAMGLWQIGLAGEVILVAFGIVLFAVSLAAALAVGLGARNLVDEQVRLWWARKQAEDAAMDASIAAEHVNEKQRPRKGSSQQE